MRAAEAVVGVVLAAAAIAWLAHGVHAHDLTDDAIGAIAQDGLAGGRGRALRLLDRAAKLNADPTPRIYAARLLMAAGDNRGAARILRGGVAENPGNVVALTSLRVAEAHFDLVAAQRATAALRALYGHLRPPATLLPGVRSDLPPGSQLSVYSLVPGLAKGVVERIVPDQGRLLVSGWAVDRRTGRPVDRLLVFSQGRLVGSGVPTVRRRDVPATGPAGFRLVLAPGTRREGLRVYGVVGHAGGVVHFYDGR